LVPIPYNRLIIKEKEKEMNEIITRIVRRLNDELTAAEGYPVSDLEAMLEEMEDFDTQCVFNIPTNSWNARQILMTYILNSRLDIEARDGLFQRAEYTLSAMGV